MSHTLDGMPGFFLKRIALPIALPLSIILNDSFATGQLPDVWKSAIISAIHKKGSKSQAINYRPVSLTSFVCKLMESIIKNHMMSFLNKEKLLSSKQHGFMPQKSTVTQLVHCNSVWQWARNSKVTTEFIYLDFSKAFDKVPHDKLFKKLRCYGISENVLEWIKSFLSDRTQVLKVENTRSNTMSVLSGIGQGTCLEPLAFILYINDLASVLDGRVQFAKFADDLKIWREVKSDIDQEQLQNLVSAKRSTFCTK